MPRGAEPAISACQDSWLRPKPPGPAPHTTIGSLDRSAMRIRILVTGGTFDKEYDELSGRLFFKDTHLPEMLRRGRCMLDVAARDRDDDRQSRDGRRGS